MAYPFINDKQHFWLVFALSILTTLSLQILSNLSNELGDALRGTDQQQTSRQAYGLQSGEITEKQMRKMIIAFVIISIILGTTLVGVSFSTLLSLQSATFLIFGGLAIIGAMTYTLGKHNYGYKGLGDLGVFIFFGLLSTMGSYYLQRQELSTEICFLSIAIGLPIVGVLNLNNIRDMDNDKKHGKRTFVVLIGRNGGKIYHTMLLVCSMLIFCLFGHYYVLLTLPILLWHIVYIFRHNGAELDKQMPVLMLTTIVIAGLTCC